MPANGSLGSIGCQGELSRGQEPLRLCKSYIIGLVPKPHLRYTTNKHQPTFGGGLTPGSPKHPKRKKRRAIFGSTSTPRQDVKHTGLSGSRGRSAMGLGCFLPERSGKLSGQAVNP